MAMRVIQVVGYKNAGKTTLVRGLVRLLSAERWRVGTVKRDAHGGEPEPDGADTRLHREAGAFMTALASGGRTMWVKEEPTPLVRLLAGMEDGGADVVIVEGFKTAAHPKVVLLRGDEDEDLLELYGIIAIAVRNPAPLSERKAAAAGFPVFPTGGFEHQPLLEFLRDLLMDT